MESNFNRNYRTKTETEGRDHQGQFRTNLYLKCNCTSRMLWNCSDSIDGSRLASENTITVY